jgi:hypothetical protein
VVIKIQVLILPLQLLSNCVDLGQFCHLTVLLLNKDDKP